MRIALVADPKLVNTNYRAYLPMQVLSRTGHAVTLNRIGDPILRPAELLGADVVHIHRYMDDAAYALLQRCHEQGVGIVWDNDDDITAVPKSNPHYKKFGGLNVRAVTVSVTRMVRLADVVTTPSPVLAEQYRQMGAADVRVVENFLPREFGGQGARKHDGFVIGWIAGLEHQHDYQQLRLKETLTRLLDAHGDVRVHSVGLGLGLPRDRYQHIPEAPFLELSRIAAGYDVGIAPLADMPFNRARSNVKLKEYAAAGVPWLASPVGAYPSLGEDEGGRLVANGDWHEAIERLIVNGRERRKLAKRAAKWGRGQGIERNIAVWESALSDAAERGRARRP